MDSETLPGLLRVLQASGSGDGGCRVCDAFRALIRGEYVGVYGDLHGDGDLNKRLKKSNMQRITTSLNFTPTPPSSDSPNTAGR